MATKSMETLFWAFVFTLVNLRILKSDVKTFFLLPIVFCNSLSLYKNVKNLKKFNFSKAKQNAFSLMHFIFKMALNQIDWQSKIGQYFEFLLFPTKLLFWNLKGYFPQQRQRWGTTAISTRIFYPFQTIFFRT